MSKLHVAIIMDGNGRWANARGFVPERTRFAALSRPRLAWAFLC
jgi:undecaprenyl pyrophosphate synthase